MTSHRDDDDQQAEAAEAPPRAFALGRTSWAKTSVLKQFKRFRGQFHTAVESLPKLEGLIDPTLLTQAFRVNSTLVKLLAEIEVDLAYESVTLFSAFAPRGEALPLFDGLDQHQVVDARATPAGPSGSSSVKAASDAQAEADRAESRRELIEEFKAIAGIPEASDQDLGKVIAGEFKAEIEKAFAPIEPRPEPDLAPDGFLYPEPAPGCFDYERNLYRALHLVDGEARARWMARMETGLSNGELFDAIVFEFDQWSKHKGGPLDKSFHVRGGDAPAFWMGDGKGKPAFEGQGLISKVRTLMHIAEPDEPAPVAPEAPKAESWGEPLKVIAQAHYKDARAAFEFSFQNRGKTDPPGFTVIVGLPSFLGYWKTEQVVLVGDDEVNGLSPTQWAEKWAAESLRGRVDEQDASELREIEQAKAEREAREAEFAQQASDPTLLINKSDEEIEELVEKASKKLEAPKAWGRPGTIERDDHTFIFGSGSQIKNGETEYLIEIHNNGVIRKVTATEYEVLNNDPSGWCDVYLMNDHCGPLVAIDDAPEAPGFHWGNPARFVHKTSVEGREATFEVEVSRDPTSESWFMSIIPPTWFASSAYDFEVDDDTAESVIVDDFASTQIDTMISAYKREKARDLAATRKQFDEKWDGLKEKASQPASEPESKPRKDLLLLESLLPPGDKGDTGPARRRWDKRIADGASDAELQSAISNEYQRWTRKEAELRGFSVSAGAGFPAYWEGPFKAGKPATLKNAPLVDAVRALFKIPQPVEPEAKLKASKRASASNSAKTKTDSVRKGSPRA